MERRKRLCTRGVSYTEPELEEGSGTDGSDSGSDSDFGGGSEDDFDDEGEDEGEDEGDGSSGDDYEDGDESDPEDEVDDRKERREALSESSFQALETLANLAGVTVGRETILQTSFAVAASGGAMRRGASIAQIADALIGPGVDKDDKYKIISEAHLLLQKILREAGDAEEVRDAHFGRGCPLWLRNLRTDMLYTCILEQAMNAATTRAATEEALLPLPAEISDNIKRLITREGMDWVDGLTPSFVRVIGAAFLAIDKQFADPDIEAIRSLARDTPTSDPGLKSKNRIFGYPRKDTPPEGFVRVTLAYNGGGGDGGVGGVRCIARGFVPSSTPAKDIVAKTVESAKTVGLGDGPLLDKALAAKFGVVYGPHHHVYSLDKLPRSLPTGKRDLRLIDDPILTPSLRIGAFAAGDAGVERRWSGTVNVNVKLVDTILNILQTTRPEVEKNANVRAVVEPADVTKWKTVLTPCDKTGKPLRAFLKNIETAHLSPRQGDDIPSVLKRLRRLALKRAVHILIKDTKDKGEWTPKIRDHSVQTWRFKKNQV